MILAVDTSTQSVGLALFDGNQVNGEIVWHSRNHHTVEIGPAIEQLFKQCGFQYQDLKGVRCRLRTGVFHEFENWIGYRKGSCVISAHSNCWNTNAGYPCWVAT